MAWRDSLYKATLDGVPMFVERGDGAMGRRVQNHEFVLRESSEPEDLGKIADEFTLEVFVLGENYAQARERLTAVLNKPGLRELIHPRLGVMTVQVGKVRWRFDRSNKETFVIPFFVHVGDTFPGSLLDSAGAVLSQCQSALDSLKSDFAGVFKVGNLPAFVGSEAAALFGGAMDTVRGLTGQVRTAIDAAAAINLAIDDAVDAVTDLIRAPLQLVNAVASVMNNVFGIDNDIERAVNAYRNIEASWGEVEPVPMPATLSLQTPARQQQAVNQAAMQRLFVTVAAIEMARFIAVNAAAINITSNTDSPFASADDAYALRDELVTTLDSVAPQSNDEVYRAIGDLQATLAQHIEAHGNSLPRVRELIVRNTVPGLVLAHRLYGDALQEDDIITRNHIANPLFIATNKTLEVLVVANG